MVNTQFSMLQHLWSLDAWLEQQLNATVYKSMQEKANKALACFVGNARTEGSRQYNHGVGSHGLGPPCGTGSDHTECQPIMKPQWSFAMMIPAHLKPFMFPWEPLLLRYFFYRCFGAFCWQPVKAVGTYPAPVSTWTHVN